jgi:ABC-type nitrate/sulfonate/bicarbonate transport system substrate-binding protein
MRPRSSARIAVAVLAAWATAGAACHRPAPDATARLIRVGYTGEADFGDLPSFVAHTRLRAAGYEVVVTHFSASDVAVQAVQSGIVNIIHGSMISAWIAASRGARIRTVMEHVANPYRLVVVGSISSCEDLTARRLALPAESAVSTHLVRAFIKEECPDAKPQVFSLTESSSRAAAFLAGGVDAGGLELSSLIWLKQQGPGRFKVLSDFSKRWPHIKTTGVHVNSDFARQRPAVVGDYIRALLAANRDVAAEPSLLVSTAAERLGRSEDWPAAARAYLDEGVWPEEGGLTAEDVQATLDFFQTYSGLDRRLTPDKVVDLRYLETELSQSSPSLSSR